MVFGFAVSAPARLLAAAMHLVHGCPRAPLGFALWNPALLVPLLNVLSLSLLFVGIFLFAAAWHNQLLLKFEA
jgi:hypothetical protein